MQQLVKRLKINNLRIYFIFISLYMLKTLQYMFEVILILKINFWAYKYLTKILWHRLRSCDMSGRGEARESPHAFGTPNVRCCGIIPVRSQWAHIPLASRGRTNRAAAPSIVQWRRDWSVSRIVLCCMHIISSLSMVCMDWYVHLIVRDWSASTKL